VDKIESERKVIDSLREMVKTYEEKIKRVIDKVWGSETLCFSVRSVVKFFSPRRTRRGTEGHRGGRVIKELREEKTKKNILTWSDKIALFDIFCLYIV
jgi:hypothetical protein